MKTPGLFIYLYDTNFSRSVTKVEYVLLFSRIPLKKNFHQYNFYFMIAIFVNQKRSNFSNAFCDRLKTRLIRSEITNYHPKSKFFIYLAKIFTNFVRYSRKTRFLCSIFGRKTRTLCSIRTRQILSLSDTKVERVRMILTFFI